jgi:hypothetical protein
MNYKKHYEKLISSRKLLIRNKKDGNYYEKHHILPKSLGGANDKNNLVLLTGKEHFIAHLLLSRMYEGVAKRKMYYALWNLCSSAQKGKRFKISAKTYEEMRVIYSTVLSERTKGKKLSKEHKQKISKSHKGKKKTREHINKIIATKKEKGIFKHSEEYKKNMSEIMKKYYMEHTHHSKGKPSHNKGKKGQTAWNKGLPKELQPNYGKIFSEETKQKISETHKGKKKTEEHKQKLRNSLIKHYAKK